MPPINKTRSSHPSDFPGHFPPGQNDELHQLKMMIQHLGEVVNNQGDIIRHLSDKLNQSLFKIGKMDEQIQIFRIGIRENRDRLKIQLKTFIELGIIDRDMFFVCNQIDEKKYLPISDDRPNAELILSRYNTPNSMPNPQ